MSKKSRANGEVQADQLQKLPTDLLILIFTKLGHTFSDIKFLCQCSMVSKRFNTTIFLIPTLSITEISVPDRHDCRYSKTLKKNLNKIIKKFSNICSLYVECASSDTSREGDINLNWKAIYAPANYCVAALKFKSITTIGAEESDNQREGEDDNATSFSCLARNYVLDMMTLHEMVISSIREHKKLQSLVISDRKKRGKISFNEEQLVELRNVSTEGASFGVPMLVKDGSGVPVLRLPLSGFLMKGVEFWIFKKGEKACDNDKVDHIINWDFEDEENVFCEASTLILRNHKDKLKTICA